MLPNITLSEFCFIKPFVKNFRRNHDLFISLICRYFDANGDGKVDLTEFDQVLRRDMATMAASKSVADQKKKGEKSKVEGRKRDPGFAWILDFSKFNL